MKRTKLTATAAAGIILVAGYAFAGAKAPPSEAKEAPKRHIDLVICLDTSGSMRGLIESAKQKLWAVVNELATAKPRPVLRVGLYHYGTPSLGAESGYVRQLCPLTSDLDEVYGKLFPLRTSGGTEYVARVIRAATNELDWNMDKGTLRIIFVAGNEPATQDEATYKLQDICKAAVSKGIIVNTIHCGDEATGRRTGWADAAAWADGQYAAINQNSGTVVIKTPYDSKISELGEKLNTTYVAYGAAGEKGRAAQMAQDKNAATLGAPAAAERAAAKAGGLYVNTKWDLVDASRQKDFDISKVKKEDLPENMRDMTVEERKSYVAEQAKRRDEMQKEIRELNEKRNEHVKQEMAKKGLSEDAAFDAALRAAVREQAQNANFQFEQK